MNAKRAKALRRTARGFYPGPAVMYQQPTGVAILRPDCARALYQDMKRAYNAGGPR